MQPQADRFSRWATPFVLFVLVLLLAGGTWFYLEQKEAMRLEVERNLTAIAQLKAQQIAEWRKDQLHDAALLQEDVFLRASIAQFLGTSNAEHRRDLLLRLRYLAEQHDIDEIILVDPEGEERLTLTMTRTLADSERYGPALATALRERLPVFVDLHREGSDSSPHTSVVTPFFESPAKEAAPLGALILIDNARQFLFPLIQSWPTPSSSAETLLVRADGNQVLFLNDLRHHTDAALNLRLPLSRTEVPAVMAVLGHRGFFQGRDYRGEEVAAVVLPIADSPWFIVSKIDSEEAFADWRFRSILLLVLLSGAPFLAGVAGFALRQREKKNAYLALYQSEAARRASVERHSVTLKAIGDAIVATDRQGRVELLNPVAERLTGWTEEEARGLELEEIFRIVNAQSGEPVENPVKQVLATGEVVGLANHTVLIAKNGKQHHISDSGAPIKDENGELTGVVLAFRDVTESYRLREAIRSERNILRLFVEHAPVAIAMFAADMTFVAVSRRFLVDYDLGDRAVIGCSFSEVLPELAERWRDRYRSCLAGSSERCEEDTFLRASGMLDTTIRWEMHPWSVHPGEIGGLVFFSEVITERKQAERALALVAQQWQTTFDAVQDVVWILDEQRRIVRSNRAAERLFHVPASELTGRYCWEIVHGPTGPAEDCPLRRAQQSLRRETMELREGDTWLVVAIDPILDADGRYAGAVHMIRDISRRKRAEEALKVSEAKFRDLFAKHAAVKLLIEAESGAILDANEAAERFYGWSGEELRRMRIQDINTLPPEEVKAAMAKARERQRVLFEFRHRRADGSIRDVAVYSSGIDIQGKKMLHAIVHDITERRNLEEQLRQSQKMESVGRLAGGVAHDFNNMLSVVIGYAQLGLEKVAPSDPVHHDLEAILDAGQRSADIVRKLLAFARKQTISPEVLDLNATVESMLKMLRRLLGEDIDLAWLPGPGLWPVRMDPSQLDQLLANLCVNARDAIEDGGKITIETDNVPIDATYSAGRVDIVPGDYVLLAVSDDGVGMERGILDNIFEPFFTTKEVGEGTGLGLATVHGIVKQNNGFINVYSEPGKGTTFKIYLPRCMDAVAATDSGGEAVVQPGHGETVLLVEDEPILLEMGQQMLGKLGYRVLAAGSPGAALTLAEAHAGTIDLLLTDVVMPEINGRELADRLHGLYPEMAILFMSGYTANVIAHRGVLDEGVVFMQKPFTKKNLDAKIREALARKAAGGAGQRVSGDQEPT